MEKIILLFANTTKTQQTYAIENISEVHMRHGVSLFNFSITKLTAYSCARYRIWPQWRTFQSIEDRNIWSAFYGNLGVDGSSFKGYEFGYSQSNLV